MWRAGCVSCIEYRKPLSINFQSVILTKKSFVLRIDLQTYAELEKWAADEFRSVNGQLEMLIDKALKEQGRKKEPAGALVKPKNKKTG